MTRLRPVIEVDGCRFKKIKEGREAAVFEETPVLAKVKIWIVVDKFSKWFKYTKRITADDFGDFAFSFADADKAMKKVDQIIERIKGAL